MKMATVYIGLNAAYEHYGMRTTESHIKAVCMCLAHRFGGYTKQVCSGGWLNEDGNLIEDTTLRLEVLLTHAHHEEQLHDFLEHIPGDFKQDCIMLTIREVDAEFIYAE